MKIVMGFHNHFHIKASSNMFDKVPDTVLKEVMSSMLSFLNVFQKYQIFNIISWKGRILIVINKVLLNDVQEIRVGNHDVLFETGWFLRIMKSLRNKTDLTDSVFLNVNFMSLRLIFLVKYFFTIFLYFFSDVPGLKDRDQVQQMCIRAQTSLESILNNIPPEQNGENIRERILLVLDSVNNLHKVEVTETFFVPILRETSIEFMLQKVFTVKSGR